MISFFGGPRGLPGPQGIKGEQGEGLIIIGQVNSTSDLPQSPAIGDAYLVGTESNTHIYIYVDTGWKDCGAVASLGPKGDKGDKGDRGDKGNFYYPVYDTKRRLFSWVLYDGNATVRPPDPINFNNFIPAAGDFIAVGTEEPPLTSEHVLWIDTNF